MIPMTIVLLLLSFMRRAAFLRMEHGVVFPLVTLS